MDLFLYAIVFGKKFNLRQLIFYRITEGLNITAIVNHLGNSVLITHYLLQHKISPEKDEMVSGIKKKAKDISKLFSFGKTIDLPVGRQSSPPPLPTEGNISSLHTDHDYEQSLIKQLEDLARRSSVLSAELSIITE